MKIKDLTNIMKSWAPLEYAEDFDNTGLLVGDENREVEGVLVTLDTLEATVDEAIEKKCNLILSFHPIIFSGLKKLTGKNYVERVVMKAIKHDIAVFAIHTALDNSSTGVNDIICEKLGLSDREILVPKRGTIKKLTTYVPKDEAEQVRNALFEIGAGNIGNYYNCSFNTEGVGTFCGNEDSNPKKGKRGETHSEPEEQLNITFLQHLEAKVLSQLFKAHPYEEVAYEVTTLDNSNQDIGMGMTGIFPEELKEKEFLSLVKKTFQTGCVRHSALNDGKIKKVAVLGGSGAFAISHAKRVGADALVTADLKYHDFFKAESSILLTDVGHYESEQFTKNGIYTFLKEKLRNFATALPEGRLILSEINTNPIQYF